MKKLNDLLTSNNVTVYSFPAFKSLENICNKTGDPVVLSTLAPALMLDKGIDTYYSPVIPRNTIFKTADDVIAADLDVTITHVSAADEISAEEPVIIASRHQGTVDILAQMYPNNIVMGSVTPDNIAGKKVVGTLPPTLIQYAAAYKAVTIKDFDYAKDGDLSGKALQDRMIITRAIKVSVEE